MRMVHVYTHIFVSLYTVSSYGRANHCSICLCVVCSYLTRKGNADIQHSLLMFKTKICYYWSRNTSCRQPFFVTLPVEVIYCTKYLLSIYIRSAPIPHLTFGFILMFVLSNQTAMHASSVYCMECLNYLLTKSYFIWKICLYEVQKGALSSCGYVLFFVFFLCVGERVCVHAKQRNCTFLKLFRSRL